MKILDIKAETTYTIKTDDSLIPIIIRQSENEWYCQNGSETFPMAEQAMKKWELLFQEKFNDIKFK